MGQFGFHGFANKEIIFYESVILTLDISEDLI